MLLIVSRVSSFAFLGLFCIAACTNKPATGSYAHPDSSAAAGVPALASKIHHSPSRPALPEPLYIAPQSQRWDFSPDVDTFSKQSMLDLSYLNSPILGDDARVTLSADGNDFALVNGEPIRFWPVNLGVSQLELDAIDAQVHFLAKRGVNMVRLHVSLNPDAKNELTSVDKAVLDKTFRVIAALKKRGVYLTFSPYWGPSVRREGWGKLIGDKWPVPRSPKTKNLGGMLFFDPVLQAAYRGWIRALLQTTNPYTGIALKDDPVLAIVQLQNEDSLLFWTFGGLVGEDLDILRAQYCAWLIKRYGSDKAVKQRWGNAGPEGSPVDDDWSRGFVSFASIWHLTQKGHKGGFKARLDDQTRFLVQTMKTFNRDMVHFIRDDIGAKALINPGNWKSASAELLDDLERYSYSDGDVMAVNRYVSGRHEGANVGWAIMSEQKYTDASVLLDPMALPVAIKQPEGYPFIVSESSWVPPLSFQAEGPFLVSVMQSLNGLDGFYWFSAGAQQWRPPSSSNGYLPSLGKWVVQGPMLLGQFPAAAVSYRLGLVSPSKHVLHEVRSVEDMLARKSPVIFERQGFDVNRDVIWQQTTATPNNVDLLRGRVSVAYSADKPSRYTRLSGSAGDGKAEVIDKQLQWDTQAGIAVIDAPASQGACGFMYGSEIVTEALRIVVENPYACVWAVALDLKPLVESQKILIQMGSRQFSTGWTTKLSEWESAKQNVIGREIVDYGKAPWQVESIDGVVTLSNTWVNTATVLDGNGLPTTTLALEKTTEGVTFKLPPNSLYLILSAK